MVRPIVRDRMFLSQKSVPAEASDIQILDDLLDTLRAHQDHCVGMAANMIGEKKRIIAFMSGPFCIGMINPVLLSQQGPYEAEEGCLSLEGVRKTIRFENIEVEYRDRFFQKKRAHYTGWLAQIIQHEIDHCNGILI